MKLRRLAVTLSAITLWALPAFASAVIFGGGGPGAPSNIPTLSSWMLVLLGLMVAGVALKLLRRM